MTKCPYCGKSFQLADFYDSEEGLFGTRYSFKGQEIHDHISASRSRMWTCPECETLLAITEYHY